ncbi:RloB family protein [Mobiluncus mulieris]|uniref:RloB family protein n=1 Tax=Mobiluncus mulieris TaxID=2052 RepID=UPI0024309881|nr:RloB family protein [Mobiluncus mulieris]
MAKKPPRNPLTRQKRPRRHDIDTRVLVVCEGSVTEPAYFRRLVTLAREKRISLTIRPSENLRFHHSNPLDVTKECVKYRDVDKAKYGGKGAKDLKPFSHCFAVVDYDRWNETGKDGSSVLQKAVKYAKSEAVNLVVTRLKFEVWLLWHLQGITPTQDSKNLDKQCEINNVLLGKDLNPGFDVNAETCRLAVSNALRAGGLQENQIPKSSLASAMPRFFEILSLL